MSNEWECIPQDIPSVDWKGNPIVISNVPVERNKKTGRIRVFARDVARAELRDKAESLDIEERDVLFFLLLYAKPGPFQRGYLAQKYKLNKMLFYQWKELEKIGLGDAIAHDEFEAAPRGPIPKNLWDDLTRLRKRGLIKVSGGRRAEKTVVCELTEEGEKVAGKLWTSVPDSYLVVTTRVKDWLFPLDPEAIKKRVHRDYPEFQKRYRLLDKE